MNEKWCTVKQVLRIVSRSAFCSSCLPLACSTQRGFLLHCCWPAAAAKVTAYPLAAGRGRPANRTTAWAICRKRKAKITIGFFGKKPVSKKRSHQTVVHRHCGPVCGPDSLCAARLPARPKFRPVNHTNLYTDSLIFEPVRPLACRWPVAAVDNIGCRALVLQHWLASSFFR